MKELPIDWNEYQKNTTGISVQFNSLKLGRDSCFTLPFNYAGLYKERSTKEASDGWDLRYPLSKTGKKFPDYEKKYPDCGHLLVKCLF